MFKLFQLAFYPRLYCTPGRIDWDSQSQAFTTQTGDVLVGSSSCMCASDMAASFESNGSRPYSLCLAVLANQLHYSVCGFQIRPRQPTGDPCWRRINGYTPFSRPRRWCFADDWFKQCALCPTLVRVRDFVGSPIYLFVPILMIWCFRFVAKTRLIHFCGRSAGSSKRKIPSTAMSFLVCIVNKGFA